MAGVRQIIDIEYKDNQGSEVEQSNTRNQTSSFTQLNQNGPNKNSRNNQTSQLKQNQASSVTQNTSHKNNSFPIKDKELVINNINSVVNCVCWSPDGTKLASASYDESVRVWDAHTGSQLAQLQGHTDAVMSVSWSGDGTKLASASYDKTVRVWDARTGSQLVKIEHRTYPMSCVAWSPDGTKLAYASYDMTVHVCDVLTGEQLAVLRGHTAGVASVCWSPDGFRLASASADMTVRVWELDGNMLSGWGRDKKRSYSVTELVKLEGHTRTVWCVSWNGDGTKLASASEDETVRVWDPLTGSQLAILQGHTDTVTSVSWNGDGTKLASASYDQTVRVWNWNENMPSGRGWGWGWRKKTYSGIQLAILEGHTDAVNSVSWNGDGTKLASASYDKTIRVWDLPIPSGGSLMKNYNITQRAIENKIKAINNKLQKFDGKFKKINIQNIKYKNKNDKYELEYNV